MRTLLAAALAGVVLTYACEGPVINLGSPPAGEDDDDDDDESDEDGDTQIDEDAIMCSAPNECSAARPHCFEGFCSECRSDDDCDGGRCDHEDRECD